jgi:DNA-binding transcriptional MocR family regulator
VDAWVRARSDVAWVRPPAGLFGFVRITAGFTARALIDGPCARRGVLVGDGAFFDAPDAFRLGLAAPGERFEQGLALLGEALDEMRAG